METFENSRIIILADDPQERETLIKIIQRWGWGADGFAHQETAFKRIRDFNYDIVLLNIFTSGVNARDIIPHLRSDLKIIVMTEPLDRDSAVPALELGAFGLLEKPFDDELLRHSILCALSVLNNERETKRLMEDLDRSRSELLACRRRLDKLKSDVFETNRALSILTRNIDREREEMESQIALKLKDLMMPIVAKLRNDPALHNYETQLDMLTYHLEDLTSLFSIDPTIAMTLSSTEMRIASLVKNGMRTDEIARQLHISENTVRSHRRNIRKKLKINTQHNLRNFLAQRPDFRKVGESSSMAYVS
jgi:DNA-binding NarL/FixJ family response regulator